MPTPDCHVVDVMVWVPNRVIGDDDIINALEALGCAVIGIHRDEPINSRLITVLPIHAKTEKPPCE